MDFINGLFLGAGIGLFVMGFQTWDWPTDKQTGFTYHQLKEMKTDCEKDLTRSENCIIVVSYKPETSKETGKDGK